MFPSESNLNPFAMSFVVSFAVSEPAREKLHAVN